MVSRNRRSWLILLSIASYVGASIEGAWFTIPYQSYRLMAMRRQSAFSNSWVNATMATLTIGIGILVYKSLHTRCGIAHFGHRPKCLITPRQEIVSAVSNRSESSLMEGMKVLAQLKSRDYVATDSEMERGADRGLLSIHNCQKGLFSFLAQVKWLHERGLPKFSDPSYSAFIAYYIPEKRIINSCQRQCMHRPTISDIGCYDCFEEGFIKPYEHMSSRIFIKRDADVLYKKDRVVHGLIRIMMQQAREQARESFFAEISQDQMSRIANSISFFSGNYFL